ncbi:uncharacterized protein DEA37_0009547 [Paragonimus westermani]|uniref:SH3 domain-containing protein n=1 Tax=Paragonimus westermani TaxID=34504 RepID=A0A5J4NAI2_9TREM|nr:uncharacterized protein DEA37_0009547 [Paragonimus westermani]
MALDLNTNGKLLREAVDCVLDGKYSCIALHERVKTALKHLRCESHMVTIATTQSFLFHWKKSIFLCLICILICTLQGEGAPEKYRIACSQHGDVVKQFCRTTHITIRARSEDDLDWADIVGKVAKVSGTDYTAPSDRIDSEPQVVSSVYKRVDPCAEIPMQFWKMKQSSCDPIPSSPAPVKIRLKPDTHTQLTCGAAFTETDTSKARFQALKAARQSEVSSLIRDRIQSFDQPVDADGTNWQRADPRSEISKAKHLANQSGESDSSDKVITKYERTDVQAEIQATRETQQKNGTDPVTHSHPAPPSIPETPLTGSANGQLASDRSPVMNNSKSEPVSSPSQEVTTQPPCAPARVDCGPVALCLYNYTAHEDDELSFHEGDQIFQVQQIDEGWWLGVTADGRQGLFPANYVELVA